MKHSMKLCQKGVTLVELMISSTLGMIVVAGAVTAVLAGGRIQRNQIILSDTAEEGRRALREMVKRIELAGIGSPLIRVSTIGSGVVNMPALSVDQGSAIAKPLVMEDGTTDASASPYYFKMRPDMLSVFSINTDRRATLLSDFEISPLKVSGDPRFTGTAIGEPFSTQSTGPTARWILVTNYSVAVALQVATATTTSSAGIFGGTPFLELTAFPASTVNILPRKASLQNRLEAGADVFPVQLVRYRIQAKADTDPTKAGKAEFVHFALVRERLNPNTPPILGTDPIGPADGTKVVHSFVVAKGVDNLQIEWGYDRDGDGIVDGVAGWQSNSPTIKDLADPALLFARISLAVRTDKELIDGAGRRLTPSVAELETPFGSGLREDVSQNANAPFDIMPASAHRHRIVQTVVPLRNLRTARL